MLTKCENKQVAAAPAAKDADESNGPLPCAEGVARRFADIMVNGLSEGLSVAPAMAEAAPPLKPTVLKPGHCPSCDGPLVGRMVQIAVVNGVPATSLRAWCEACDRAVIPPN